MTTEPALRRSDVALLVTYSFLLFGISLWGGRPLTLHEAVLPQSAREMYADHDWIVPKKGGEPWLESPPLPQWCTVAVATAFGHCDSVWVVRLGPILVATACVLMTAWMATVWYGRTIGLLSGLVLASICQFTRYAWLAEDEIYLCGLVTAAIAWFVKLEFANRYAASQGQRSSSESTLTLSRLSSMLLGTRSWPVVMFFVLLGMTNLAKGLIFGTAMVVIPLGGWLLWNRAWGRLEKYVWLWGACLFLAIMLGWPLAASWRNPGVVDVWMYDLGGRVTGKYTEINQPLWYYPVNLLWMLAPWTLALPFGLATSWQAVKTSRDSPERFLWVWALAVPLVFSIPGGKHHHYLLHALAPWAVLTAIGLDRCRSWLATWPRWLAHPVTGVCTLGLPLAVAWAVLGQQPFLVLAPALYWGGLCAIPLFAAVLTWGLHHPQPRLAAVTVFTLLWGVYAVGHWFAGRYVDVNRHDVAMLQQTRELMAEKQLPIVVDLSRAPLTGFLELFHLPEEARAIHNVSFLVDERLPSEFLLLTSHGNIAAVRDYADVAEINQSQRPLKPREETSRLTLLSVRLKSDLARQSVAEIPISPMQAMKYAEGPDLAVRR